MMSVRALHPLRHLLCVSLSRRATTAITTSALRPTFHLSSPSTRLFTTSLLLRKASPSDTDAPPSHPPGTDPNNPSNSFPLPRTPITHNRTDSEVLSQLHTHFTIPPLTRNNEDLSTIRSRLQYQSRKRGILETDLLLSTFADENLRNMDMDQLKEYDRFLDENDWDIYYWCTQTAPETEAEYAEREGGGSELATEAARGEDMPGVKLAEGTERAEASGAVDAGVGKEGGERGAVEGAAEQVGLEGAFAAGMDTSGAGEWAQTVGKRKEPYRRPPERWINSEILKRIREHVEKRKAKGSGVKESAIVDEDVRKSGSGLGRMPSVRIY